MTVKTIMNVKKFQGYFSASFFESSMLAFIVFEPLSKLIFDISNIRSHTTHFTFQKVQYFFRVTI